MLWFSVVIQGKVPLVAYLLGVDVASLNDINPLVLYLVIKAEFLRHPTTGILLRVCTGIQGLAYISEPSFCIVVRPFSLVKSCSKDAV